MTIASHAIGPGFDSRLVYFLLLGLSKCKHSYSHGAAVVKRFDLAAALLAPVEAASPSYGLLDTFFLIQIR
jgi:hypothetical protein